MTRVLGIHHVTAIAADPQRNVDFYAGILGLRFVKRTVNFDDPQTYHFYYGDEVGTPGTIMTFFPWPGGRRGRQGTGQVAVTSFAVLPTALGFWLERLIRHGVRFEGPRKRGAAHGETEQVLALRDHDGLMLEIVAHPGADSRPGWGGAPGVPQEHAIRGFHTVTLWEEGGDDTERLLVDTLGFRPLREEEGTRRYTTADGEPGSLVDVRTIGGFPAAASGVGTVHHVAWSVADDAVQLAMRQRVIDAGLEPTPVIDRSYFHSVYFREPGGVLFELATRLPGFSIDEPVETLGERLMLPPQYEPHRAQLEAALPPIHLPMPLSDIANAATTAADE
jgi:catechol 2,3-dioxygenase-like lactoylglutathione lyase family enzyme